MGEDIGVVFLLHCLHWLGLLVAHQIDHSPQQNSHVVSACKAIHSLLFLSRLFAVQKNIPK